MYFKKNIFLFLFYFSFVFSAYGQTPHGERILSYDSQIVVNDDSTMTVTENIKVTVEGEQIRHGIYRDFPTRYKDIYGNDYVVDFTVIKILCNGVNENYRTVPLSNGERIYIGNKNVYLTPGEYTYTISYKTDRQLGFFKNFDELYWNITGNGWSFPIDKIQATVALPQDAGYRIIEASAYIGYQGSKGRDVTASKDSLGRIIFTTSRPLKAGEGLTIVLEWPKGYVKAPTLETKAKYLFRDNSGGILAAFGLLILTGYYLIVWARVGKDPAKGTIIPLYEPPNNLTPAEMRYIMKIDFDDKLVAATIINMAVKGYVTIKEDAGAYELERKEKADNTLLKEEIGFSKQLFGTDLNIELKNTNCDIINGAKRYLRKFLEKSCEKIYFITNKKYFITGSIISLVLMFVSAAFQNINSGHSEKLPMILFMCVWLSIWTTGITALLYNVASLWRASLKSIKKLSGAILLSFFCVPFVIGELFGLSILLYATSFLIICVVLAVIFVNILFYRLLKAPTLLGRKIMDKIEGFRMYLSVAEKDRLNVLNPEQKTPELFEKYLPYAFALDVEQRWAEKFSDILNKAGTSGESYHPIWYSGSIIGTFSATSFASGLSAGFATAVSSSSVSPGSSSGGGGGGSSGGGGGGGGGGGW